MPTKPVLTTAQQIQRLETDPDYVVKFTIDNNPEAVLANIQSYSGNSEELSPAEMLTFIMTLFEAARLDTVIRILNVEYNPESNNDYTGGLDDYFKEREIELVAQNLQNPVSSDNGTFYYSITKAVENVKDTLSDRVTAEDLQNLKLPESVINALSKILSLGDLPEKLDIEQTEVVKKHADKKKAKGTISIPSTFLYFVSALIIILVLIMIFKSRE